MRTYSVLAINNESVEFQADGVDVQYGALLFYKYGEKTEEEKYPDPITIMVFAPGTWTLVTLDDE